jgi:nucleoside 2-deoxyribosyltransferase
MSFKEELNPAFDDGIRPAVADDCGFDIVRVDRVEHVENINDKIMADLRRAQFVVADFTRHPAGVYFEAGFALGLGRLVIWTCHRDDFHEKVHFDTRPYNHILWTEPAELRERLGTQIKALMPNPRA